MDASGYYANALRQRNERDMGRLKDMLRTRYAATLQKHGSVWFMRHGDTIIVRDSAEELHDLCSRYGLSETEVTMDRLTAANTENEKRVPTLRERLDRMLEHADP